MASWRMVALVGLGALGAVGCGKSSSGDDDSAGTGGSGTSGSGGSSGAGGSGAVAGAGATDGSGGLGMLPKACGSLTSADARRIVTTNVGTVLHAAVTAAQFTEGSTFIAHALQGGSQTSDAFEFADDANKSIDDFIDGLNKNVFPDANVESTTDNSVTYHPTPDVNCPLDQDLATYAPDLAAQDRQDCVDNLSKHPERYVVSRVDCGAGDVLTISLEVGADGVVPGYVTAAPTSLSLTLDVAAFVHAEQAYGDDTDYDANPTGTASFVLDTSTQGVATFAASLSSELALGATDSASNHERVTLAAGTNLLAMKADARARTFTGSLNLATLGVSFPFRSFVEQAFNRDVTASTPASDDVAIAIPAVKGAFTFDRAADTLKLTGLGLGSSASTVNNGGATILSVDVNPDDGRSLDATIGLDASGNLQVSPAPGFDLELGYSMNAVANKVLDLEAFAKNDTVAFKLLGSSPMVTLLADVADNLALASRDSGAAMRVNAGTFTLTSSTYAPNENVTVPAGQCLFYEAARNGTHDILRGYYAGNCP
jgi:hypothetical protein